MRASMSIFLLSRHMLPTGEWLCVNTHEKASGFFFFFFSPSFLKKCTWMFVGILKSDNLFILHCTGTPVISLHDALSNAIPSHLPLYKKFILHWVSVIEDY